MEVALLFFQQIQYIYLFYLIITNFSTTVMTWITLKQMILNYFYANDLILHKLSQTDAYKPISILAPAFNEEMTIISSVYSLLKLDFKEYEILIINDGSSDDTLKRVVEHFNLYKAHIPGRMVLEHQPIRAVYRSHEYKHLMVVDKVNGRKSDALNAGINIATYPLVCCVDADTILEKDAILQGLKQFLIDRRMIAVGGAIGITNGSVIENHELVEKRVPKPLVEAFQVLEYLRGFFAGRVGWQKYDGLILISGAFGIFSKDLIQKVGGYRHTIGEDFDLLIRMRKHCFDNGIDHSVGFVAETLCWTQCPSDYGSLLKQRNRWHRGLLEVLIYHKDMLFNPKYKFIGMVTMPYFLFIEALGPAITFLGVISIIIFYLYGIINASTLVIFFLLEFVWGIMLNITALYLEIFTKHSYSRPTDFIKLFILGLIEPFFYKPLLKAELFMASFDFNNANWGEIKRKAL